MKSKKEILEAAAIVRAQWQRDDLSIEQTMLLNGIRDGLLWTLGTGGKAIQMLVDGKEVVAKGSKT